MNMLRVWGGGLYEDHAFYEHCDAIGMLVWQDFLMACACYPEEEPFWSWLEAEARDNVARLVRHPSLVLWNGCNENIWGTFDWAAAVAATSASEGERTWGLNYYLDLFPGVVGEIAPTTPYWPGSPYSGSMDRHPNANEFGNRHIWDVWNGNGDYRNYLGHFPRFASEFGYPGPADLARPSPAPCRRRTALALRHRCTCTTNKRQGQQRALDRIADDFDGLTIAEHPTVSTTVVTSPSVSAVPGADAGLRVVPGAVAVVQRRAVLAAQRLLAGHQLVRHRRRRPTQSPAPRHPRVSSAND